MLEVRTVASGDDVGRLFETERADRAFTRSIAVALSEFLGNIGYGNMGASVRFFFVPFVWMERQIGAESGSVSTELIDV